MKKFILLLIVASASVLRLTSIPAMNRSTKKQQMIQASNRCHSTYKQIMDETGAEWWGNGSKKGPYYSLPQTDPTRKKLAQNFVNKRQAAYKNFEACRYQVVKMYGHFMWVTEPTGGKGGQPDKDSGLRQYFPGDQRSERGIGM